MLSIKPVSTPADNPGVMDYRFREIRKADLPDALAFAKGHGVDLKPGDVRHHLSLLVKLDAEIVGVGLCVEPEVGHHDLRMCIKSGHEDETLAQQLADRVLRKFQSDGIGTARMRSSEAQAEDNLWQQTNWLERIGPVTPPHAQAEAEPCMPAADQDTDSPLPAEPAQAA